MKRWSVEVAAMTLVLALGGCDVSSPTAASQSGAEPSPPRQHMVKPKNRQPIRSAKRPSQSVPPATLTPIGVVTLMPGAARPTISATANLTGTETGDHVTVATTADGSGTLTVTNRVGTPIFTNNKVSAAYVWKFGPRHLPVLLLQSSQFYCGTGGCQYQAYTWNATSHRFVQVKPPTTTAYLFDAGTHQFTTVQVPVVQGLFGFIQVRGNHLVMVNRLYDAWQHAAVAQLAYIAAGSQAGTIQATGRTSYEPTRAISIPAETPLGILQAFFESRSLNLPLQGKPLIASGDTMAVWKATAPVTRLGDTVFFPGTNPRITKVAQRISITTTLAGHDMTRQDTKLHQYRVVADLNKAGGTYRLIQATLTPISLKVSSIQDVLALLAQNDAFITDMAKYPRWAVEVEPVGANWQVDVQGPRRRNGSASFHSILTVNAKTGAVNPTP